MGNISLTKNLFFFSQIPFVSFTNQLTVFSFPLDTITASKVQYSASKSTEILELNTENQTYLFTGFSDCEDIHELIQFLLSQFPIPKSSCGFSAKNSESFSFIPLENPQQILSATFNCSLEQLRSFLNDSDVFSQVYIDIGNENIVVGAWEKKEGYIFRQNTYEKQMTAPVVGHLHLFLKEFHRVFELPNTLAYHITTDLGKTPYADCFDTCKELLKKREIKLNSIL